MDGAARHMREKKSTLFGVLFLYQEMALQKYVEHILRRYDVFAPEYTVLAACSGGTDSIVLLNLLAALRSAGGPRVVCAHFEHGIRGEESRADARFVEEFCGTREIPFVLERGDVPASARAYRLSMETAARKCRYDFLRRVCADQKCTRIILAHHADDLAETVLMRILRGTGPAGLAAMREDDGILLRPFLSVTRAEIEAYAEQHALNPRHDATNDLPDARRNCIRNILMPQLRRDYNPAVRDALTRLSVLAGEEDDFLTGLADEALLRAESTDGLRADVLRDLHPALQRRVLRLFWTRTTGAVQDFSFLHEECLRGLLDRTGSAECGLAHGWRGVFRYGVLMLCPPAEKRIFAWEEDEEILLPLDWEYGIINFQGAAFRVRRLTAMTADDRRRMTDADAVYADRALLPPIVLRTRRPGDRMRLSVGQKKIKDIFIDDKVPRERRDEIPLAACMNSSEIFWIAGGRRSTLAPVTESSRDIISIEYVKETTAK